jgi:Family of unknown function (DUF7000)
VRTFQESMNEYREQLQKGAIQQAYRGLMDFMMSLRTNFQKNHPDYVISGSIYQGYMDMTYFSVFPRSLKEKDLKIAVVFLHESFRFEVWLSGSNRKVQERYWKIIRESHWEKYRLVSNPRVSDSILEHVLVDNPDFGDPERLKGQIETGTLRFIADMDDYFSSKNPQG